MAEANDKLGGSAVNIGQTANTSQLVMAQLYEIEYQLNRGEDLDKCLKELSKDKDYKTLKYMIKEYNGDEKAKAKIDKLSSSLAEKHNLNKWIVEQDVNKVKQTMVELQEKLKLELSKLSSLEGMSIDEAKREFMVSIQAELKRSMIGLTKNVNGKAYAPLYFKNAGVKGNLERIFLHTNMDEIVSLDINTKIEDKADTRLEDLFDFDFLEQDKYRKHIDMKMYNYGFEKIIQAHKQIKSTRLNIANTRDMDERKALEALVSDIKEGLKRDLKDFAMVDKDGNVILTKSGKVKSHNINISTKYRMLKDCISPSDNVEDKQIKKECMKLVIELFGDEVLKCFQKGVGVTPFSRQKRKAETLEKEIFKLALEQAELYEEGVRELAKDTIIEIRGLDLQAEDVEQQIGEILTGHEERLTEIRNRVNIDGVVEHSYNTTLYNFSKDIGFVVNFNKINPKVVKKILTEPFHGVSFGERLDNSVQTFEKEFQAIMLNMQLTGASIDKAVNMFNSQVDHNCYGVRTLIRTQSTYYANRASVEAMEEIGVSKFIYVATLDSRTSTICQELDGKVFDVSDTEHLPPQHPNCRSTTVASFGNDVLDKNRTRLAKDKSGNWIRTKGITYKEYAEQYLN